MITERIMDQYSAKADWDWVRRYELCLQYIENQQDSDTWASFLYEEMNMDLTEQAMSACEGRDG